MNKNRTFLVLASMACITIQMQAQEKPNILFMLIDDIGYGDLGCHGNPIVKTPNIDQLCHDSFQFENFCVSPTSAPTRCALMTGKNEMKSNVTHTRPGRNNMELNALTIAEILKTAGYTTGIFGKWHLGETETHNPIHQGFDKVVGILNDNQHSHYDPLLQHNGITIKHKGYRTNILFNEAMDFIKQNKNKPFFCYLPTFSAHVPHVVPHKYAAPYEKIKGAPASYYGMIANVDENIGRMLRFLKENGLEKNTLVIFMNDNGTTAADVYNAGMRGRKGLPWLGGIRASSFWKWPKGIKPAICDRLTAHVDVYPTLAEIGGATIPTKIKNDLEGISLTRYFNNPIAEEPIDRMIVHHKTRWLPSANYPEHKYAGCCVRWQDYTLVRTDYCNHHACLDCAGLNYNAIHHGKDSYGINHYKNLPKGKWGLYNVKYDRSQTKDLSDLHPEIVEKMSTYYNKWWKDVENRLDKYYANPTIKAEWDKCDKETPNTEPYKKKARSKFLRRK